jgi:hypothetical protein
MKDLTDARWIWAKGILFLLLGVAASALLIVEAPTLKIAALLALVVWSFCRAYYFAFYVIEHYVDSGYRFAGLLAFVRYALRKRS